jgi:hypothetical protein
LYILHGLGSAVRYILSGLSPLVLILIPHDEYVEMTGFNAPLDLVGSAHGVVLDLEGYADVLIDLDGAL